MKYKKAKRDTLNNVNLIYSVEGRYGNYYTQHLWAALHFTQKPLPSHSKLQLTLRFYNTISNDKENVALYTMFALSSENGRGKKETIKKIWLQKHFLHSCPAI